MDICLAQINPTVGDIAGNYSKIFNAVKSTKAKVVAFPEMSIVGYPVEDLAFRYDFITESEESVANLAKQLDGNGLGDKFVIVGSPRMNSKSITNKDFFKSDDIVKSNFAKPYNTAFVLHRGKIVDFYDKKSLPNYGVFDDFRIWTAGTKTTILEIDGKKIAIIICEDVWNDKCALELQGYNIDATIVINASVFEIGKPKLRYKVCLNHSKITNAPVFYVNMVGGQDGLIFEGGSFAIDHTLNKIIEAPKFKEYNLVTNLNLSGSNPISIAENENSNIYNALVLGVGDYVRKNGFEKVILGLSGGIDSALSAAIASDAIGGENVIGVLMPSKFSSEHSITDALETVKLNNIISEQVDIQPFVDLLQDTLQLENISYENLQSRVRGLVLMSLSNKYNALCLANGNKSELAIGYSTIFGDSVGAYAPIMDLTKSRVFEIAKYRNTISKVIPENSISKEPSAELRENQKDSDTIGDYDTLDKLIEGYVELRTYPNSNEEKSLAKKIDFQEYKRRLYPIGTKITKLAFGKDRRLPITNKF
jgi:NAD+ synthase (glutamine-hydrolysing)